MNIEENYNYWLEHRDELDKLEQIQHSARVNLCQVLGINEQKTAEYQAEIRRNKYTLRRLNKIFHHTGWRYRVKASHK